MTRRWSVCGKQSNEATPREVLLADRRIKIEVPLQLFFAELHETSLQRRKNSAPVLYQLNVRGAKAAVKGSISTTTNIHVQNPQVPTHPYVTLEICTGKG